MSLELRHRLFQELDALPLIDPHTHINALDPASHTLADILGYHYYTELAHSAGLPKSQIEQPGLEPREKVRRLIANLGPIDNTIQYSWFLEMLSGLFDISAERVTADNCDEIFDATAARMANPNWSHEVLRRSKLEGVFLTNDFDDPLAGFDTAFYIPCLRTDDLVFHLGRAEVRQRLEAAAGMSVDNVDSLRDAIGRLFHHFTLNNARACAISLPPDFTPSLVSPGRAKTAIDAVLRRGAEASDADRRAASSFVFWTLAEYCHLYRLPFDLMIGVNRGVYGDGVHQGRDLYDSRVSLIQYKALFNAFPEVTFPVSVLASVTNQELASYAWIFPNVVTNGHWWYSNTPTFIEHDLAARLEAVPRTKQIGYYSDMYKLEFALPKFAMYKRILAKVLAERFVQDRGWSEERAVELGKQVLRGNVETTFGFAGPTAGTLGVAREVAPQVVSSASTVASSAGVAALGLATAATAAAIAAPLLLDDETTASPNESASSNELAALAESMSPSESSAPDGDLFADELLSESSQLAAPAIPSNSLEASGEEMLGQADAEPLVASDWATEETPVVEPWNPESLAPVSEPTPAADESVIVEEFAVEELLADEPLEVADLELDGPESAAANEANFAPAGTDLPGSPWPGSPSPETATSPSDEVEELDEFSLEPLNPDDEPLP